MLKILLILIVYYVIIISTDSRSRKMFENKFNNEEKDKFRDGIQIPCNNTDTISKNVTILELTNPQIKLKKSSDLNQTSVTKDISLSGNENKTEKFALNGRPSKEDKNNTDEELKNVTSSQNITLVELTSLQNSSEKSIDLNINQTSIIESKSINGNKTHLLNDSTYVKDKNNTDERQKNVTTAQNITLVELIGLQNNSKKPTALNLNQTFVTEGKSPNSAENKTIDNLDSLNDKAYVNEEKTKNVSTSQNTTRFELTDLQNNSEKPTVINLDQTYVIENKSLNGNENKTKEYLDPLTGITYEKELTPTVNPNLENNVNGSSTNNANITSSDGKLILGNRIGTNAIITLMGGPG